MMILQTRSSDSWTSISGHAHSYYVRTASAFRKRLHLLVKGILRQAILECLKVYYAVITPKLGLSVAFPSNHKFVHAVPRFFSGKRYFSPVWFIVKSAKAMQI
jgi:hypothetical protein